MNDNQRGVDYDCTVHKFDVNNREKCQSELEESDTLQSASLRKRRRSDLKDNLVNFAKHLVT